MHELIKQKFTLKMNNEDKINRTREFLQVLMLKIIFDRGFFDHLAFVGGTALRILYGMRRFSEDLDFSLIKKHGYDFKSLQEQLQYELKQNNLKIEMSKEKESVVHSLFIKFPELLNELGLSKLKSQKIAVKLEIDTNPPGGWHNSLIPLTESFVLAINSFDLPSLYATKLHACFFRQYIKGRDFYDLVWYLGKKIEPNYILLNNAIRQTEGEDLNIKKDNLGLFLQEKLKKIDFNFVRKDVERFLEDKNELKLLEYDTILKMISLPK